MKKNIYDVCRWQFFNHFLINRKEVQMKKYIPSLLFFTLLTSTVGPLKCFSIKTIPSSIISGISSSTKLMSDKTVNLAKIIAFVTKTGVLKTTGAITSGTIKTVSTITDGVIKTFDFTKAGILKTIPSKKSLKLLATGALIAATFRFFMKEPSNDPVRFDQEALKKAVNDNDYKEMAKQVGYFLDDVVIGRSGKRSSVRVDEKGKLDVRPGKNPMGVGGNIHLYMPALTKTLAFVLTFQAFKKSALEGLNSWREFVVAE